MRVYIKEAEPDQAVRAMQLLRQAFPGVLVHGAPARAYVTKLGSKSRERLKHDAHKNWDAANTIPQHVLIVGIYVSLAKDVEE